LKIKSNKFNKKITVIVIAIVLILFFIIFRIYHYKNIKTGNNITDKTLQEIESYILNISSYEAEIELKVESNKNSNKYIIKQKFEKPNICYQEVVEPKNIEGLTVKYDGKNLEVSNTKLNLSKIYEYYQYITDNVLWLSDFIENYKANNGTISEKDGIIIMENRCKENTYITSEKLYIDRNANRIIKLEVEDENNKTRIYITYNEIKI
jgi:outer membrane lipoprotein-sorting protein